MQAIKSELPVSSPAEAALLDATLSRSADQTTSTSVSQRHQLQRLAAAHNVLKSEHRMLQDRHDVHVRFLQLLVDLKRPRSVEELSGTQSEARRASVLAELRARSPARMQHPLSVAECHLIGLNVYDEIQAFTESEAYMNTGGWENQRWVEDGLLKLSVQKVFPDLTPHEMAARTWPVLTSPERLQSFYSASMKMHCEVAQRVDENNVVLYEEYEANERDPVTGRETDVVVLVRSLVLVTLLPVNSGYTVLFYGIDPNRLHERDEAAAFVSVGVSERKLWRNKVSWWLWQDAGEHTTTTFVSSVPVEGESSSYWTPIELLLLAMRWGNEVIGPTFTLSSEDDSGSVARQPTLTEACALRAGGQCLQQLCMTRTCSPSKTAEAPTGASLG